MGHEDRCLPGTVENFDGEHGVHRTTSEALKVERDVGEAELLEYFHELIGHPGLERARHLLAGDLNAHEIAMVPHPELFESEGTKRILALLHLEKGLASYRPAVFDTGGETSGGGFLPYTQTGSAGEFADVLLAKTGVKQRRGDAVTAGCLLPGTEISLIIEVHTVCDGVIADLFAERFHDREELVLAMEAAHGVIPDVVGLGYLVG